MVVCILGGLLYVLEKHVVWQDYGGFVNPSHSMPRPSSPSVITAPSDDDIIYSASTPSYSSRIQGDYSTVQNTHDLLALAARVPVLCFDSRPATAMYNRLNRNNTHDRLKGNNKRQKKTVHTVQDCPCAILKSEDDINTRTSPVPGKLSGWEETHARNVRMANLEESSSPSIHDDTAADSTPIAPNVVFLGDSITERWRGTKLGKVESKDMQDTQKIFAELFQNEDPDAESSHPPMASIHGLPLGIAGDQTPNLLWRLENGELPNTLQPQIFVVLIGVNDLSMDWCSPENVVVGIIRIVEYLLTERPEALILLHGLLPRTIDKDGYLKEARDDDASIYSLGHYFSANHNNDDDGDQPNFWPDIQLINDELRGTSSDHVEMSSEKHDAWLGRCVD